MSLQTLHPAYDGGVVALSVIIAIYASYVGLDLARRAPCVIRPTVSVATIWARWWWLRR
ncbi:MHYT domain-containing protein [Rhodanobacter sp. BL-MT-08]